MMTLLAAYLCVASLQASVRHSAEAFTSAGKRIRVELYCDDNAAEAPAVLILHGTGGPQPAAKSHAAEWHALSRAGYCVYVPHYLDATGGSARNPGGLYEVWVRTVTDAIRFAGRKHPRGMALIGYSLGASIALAVASQGAQINAVVAWSGSLPDEYFRSFTTMPPALVIHGEQDSVIPAWNAKQFERLCLMRRLVCEVKFYPHEGHGFSASAAADANHRIETFLERFLPVSGQR